ncbi:MULTISPECIES: alkaline phosphatase [Alkalimonas]|uniref:Alkaline phosphatase n=1 Tax=Alkalimonas mucilaginosa TaxID=3057676 RepID=A0ABU7JI97_9GAMM|nr:alkaline phosphatase [Alkalimonas sp. MEB004]MEE2025427.1 alkaline phosphatase [Alkalimonas sp. MEB004]
MKMSSCLTGLLASSLLLGCSLTSTEIPTSERQVGEATAPKNIIFMIGDGMGANYLTAYRYYLATEPSAEVAATIFDELWLGISSTYPADNTFVTDSAASATALATGVKTFNGAIAVDQQHLPIGTMMQLAKRLGKANGIVASSQVNHATPAGFLAHNPSRRNYDAIADMYLDYRVDGQIVADVILGGGTEYFIREDRNLVAEFKANGYQYADNWQDLAQLTQKPALALLAEKGLPSALNNPEPRPLARLTEKALKLLAPNEQGFLLMVEGSQIDWCGHANDIACAMAEMADFAEAVAVAKHFVDQHPDTLLVITADHETGGLSIGADGIYAWLPQVIMQVQMTAAALAEELQALNSAAAFYQRWMELTAIELPEDVQASLFAARTLDRRAFRFALTEQINRASHTGWTTTGHTAADVPVLAYGKWQQDFAGFQDNTDIARQLMQYVLRYAGKNDDNIISTD